MKISGHHELQLNEDYPFNVKMWRVQRWGWLLIGLFILAAALGFFGRGGWLSPVEQKNSWGVLSYDRFLRWQGPTFLELRVESGALQNGGVEIWVSNDYIRQMKTETFFPVPESIVVHGDRSRFFYRAEKDEGGKPLPIFLRWQTEEIGFHEGRIGLSGQSEVFRIRQFVYP